MKNFKIFPIGSCRVNDPIRSKQKVEIPKLIYTHSTKEALQMVKVLLGDSVSPVFYECNAAKDESFSTIKLFDCILIEICTRKVFYFKKGGKSIYCNNAKAEELTKAGIEVFHYEQDESEIYEDLLEIKSLLSPRLIAITGHIVPPAELIDEESSYKKLWESRNSLRKLLASICMRLTEVKVLDVSSILKEISPNMLFSVKRDGLNGLDMNHYNPRSFVRIGEFYENKLKPTVLVATPGKVGTVALVKLFKSSYNTSVLPNHNLNVLKDAVFKRSNLEDQSIGPLKVVTGVRHPLDFVISAFCQIIKAGRLQHLSYNRVEKYLNIFEDEGLQIIENYFSWLSKFLFLSQCNNSLQELEETIKVKGYYTSNISNFDVNFFIYRFEDLVKEEDTFEMLKSWGRLGDEVIFPRENVAPKEGVIGEVYEHLKFNLSNYKKIVEKVKASNIYGFFYTKEEIDDNLKKYGIES